MKRCLREGAGLNLNAPRHVSECALRLSPLGNNQLKQEILDDFPELEQADILAVLAYAADREHKVYSLVVP